MYQCVPVRQSVPLLTSPLHVLQTNDRKTTIGCTPNYIAPEILNQKKFGHGHSYEVDIWSLEE